MQPAPRTKQSDAGAVGSRASSSRSESQPSDIAPTGQEDKSICPECESLRAQAEELRSSRDEALLALAKERELLWALRAKYSTAEQYLRTAQQPPLRYVIVDKLNHALKSRFEILHLGARKATAYLLRLTKIQK